MNFIQKLIFNGEIPYFNVLKNILRFVPFLWILILLYPKYYVEIWDLGWYCLLFIVFSRPLSDVLPKLGILKKFVALRKEIWIISWIFIVAHWLWFFLASKISVFTGLSSGDYYNLTNLFGWGMIGMYIGIILTITSNKFSKKLLGRNWKRLQRFTYLFFIFWAIHIAFFDPEKILPLLMVVGLWAVLWILAWKRVVLLK
ncbi:MAG: hypothetical protein ACD_78C00176G0001 [uncultured bacterium (gcode 4)]|uniref:Ferric oxidoreductase domain-containing protein n=1 Tax=uncultured bacterium (gcode 4) TaxID=1234023 RepID=K1YXD7_9BACT|nr:MAG: hypothetical protein ACD_78C00176G0001 [uncultured bacterium (gcode 4)]